MSNKKKSLEIDVDKMLALVKARPAIYNLQEQNSKDMINKLWKEVGEELGISVSDCKAKWHSLRTSYARYLRQMKNTSKGSAAKKTKWHLADAMSFLETHIGPRNKITKNFSMPSEDSAASTSVTGNEETDEFEENEQFNDTIFCEIKSEEEDSVKSDETATASLVNERNKNNEKPSIAEIGAASMDQYQWSATARSLEEEDPTLTFFRSLLPDVNMLDSRRQRNFKAKVIKLLNSFRDSQEESEFASLTCPTVSHSDSADS